MPAFRLFFISSSLIASFCGAVCASEEAGEISADELQFFESKVRPVLAEHCYECHAADSEKLKGGFLIDSKAGWQRGGDTGAAIIPGDATGSLMMKMMHHEPGYEAMPPKSKLGEQELKDLAIWINNGAYDPRDQEIGELKNEEVFDLEERKKWWSFQPIKDYEVPSVAMKHWPTNEVDHFILSKLEESQWQPSEPASKYSLLRRLSFDLTGLAPTPEEVASFIEDESPLAYEKLIDRLLSSSSFGEKWARHWMDVVRYGETKSFESDYKMIHAYAYRDYLIRMFNDDVPYKDFVMESLAGDLVKKPRLSNGGKINESIKGPGFVYLTDGQHGPPDLHDDEARIFSGIIDTTSKAFLGMTVACAECHDHKFDAITAGDYYSWYGMLRSSRLNIANTIMASEQLAPVADLKALKSRVFKAGLVDAKQDIDKFDQYMLAISKHQESAVFGELQGENKKQFFDPKLIKKYARAHQLDESVLGSWAAMLLDFNSSMQGGALAPLLGDLYRVDKELSDGLDVDLATGGDGHEALANMGDWFETGEGFSGGAVEGGDFEEGFESVLSVKSAKNVIQTLVQGKHATAGRYSGRITGSLRSPDFILDGRPIEFYTKGVRGRVRLIIRNYEQAGLGPTTLPLMVPVEGGSWQKVSIPTVLWKGEPAYLEVLQDGASRVIRAPLGRGSDDSFISISATNPLVARELVGDGKSPKLELQQLWQRVSDGQGSEADMQLLSALFAKGLIRAGADRSAELKGLIAKYKSINNRIPQPSYARSLVDGTPQDVPIYIRGNHKSLSEEANPRRFLDALGGDVFDPASSGRLELAEHFVDEQNPLLSRVMVNRLWYHLFGAGIVPSLNDFGVQGAQASHPELLDFLAADFMKNDWSVKQMLRKMVLSSTYQMSTLPSKESMSLDPENTLLQHMPLKRLEAEQIRDHILHCSHELKEKMYGASVQAYVADLPAARGKPKSGPVDGGGRRSVYLELRRNFMPSFLRILDMPNGTESVGKRGVTNVPAQSLAMMNSEFAALQAKAWAKQVLSDAEGDELSRIEVIHQRAFSRPATTAEIEWSGALLKDIRSAYLGAEKGGKSIDVEWAVWQDFCHVVMNRKEFIYLF